MISDCKKGFSHVPNFTLLDDVTSSISVMGGPCGSKPVQKGHCVPSAEFRPRQIRKTFTAISTPKCLPLSDARFIK